MGKKQLLFLLLLISLTSTQAWSMDHIKRYAATVTHIVLDRQHGKLHAKLFKAAEEADIKKLQKLLKRSTINANAQDPNGNTPLHLVVRSSKETSACIDLLVQKGAQLNTKNREGNTPLEIAAGFGTQESIVALVANGALQDAHANPGIDALYSALFHERADIIEKLLELGIDPNQTKASSYSPILILAFERLKNSWSRSSIIESLLRAGARIHCLSRQQEADSIIRNTIYSPLLHAIDSGNIDQVKRLLTQGASLRIDLPRFLDQGDWSLYKYYPLNIATNCQKPNLEMVRFLIDAGGLRDNPYDLLRNSFIHGSLDMAQVLITHIPNYIIKANWNRIAIPLLCSDRIRTMPKNIQILLCKYCVRYACIEEQIKRSKSFFKTSKRICRQMSWCTLEESVDINFTELESSNALDRYDPYYYPYRETGAAERARQIRAPERDDQYRKAYEHILDNVSIWQQQIDYAILNRPIIEKIDANIEKAKQ